MIKRLKTVNPFFTEIWKGRKTAELRFNDCDFQLGDEIWLDEWILNFIGNTGRYVGRSVKIKITHIVTHSDFPDALNPGWVMLSFHVLKNYKEDAMF